MIADDGEPELRDPRQCGQTPLRSRPRRRQPRDRGISNPRPKDSVYPHASATSTRGAWRWDGPDPLCIQAARDRGLRVVPICPFFAAYMDEHQEEQDLLDPPKRKAPRLH